MTLNSVTFKNYLTGLVEQSTNPVSFNSIDSSRFIVAYSGGLDSHVLLHLMHACQFNTLAVYIDHGLQDKSSSWSAHCASVCKALEIPFQSISVNAQPDKGQSTEASARGARYKALAEVMQAGDILLTAQHLHDQAETFILQLLRTAGPAGLSAMPEVKSFAAGYHLRPLLKTQRSELEAYAKQQQLSWIEDPSNTDQNYDRNFLRHSVVPVLQKRWPSINQTLSNASLLQAEASELMTELAAIDAEGMIDGDTLDIRQLQQLSSARQKNSIRYWLQQLSLDIPTAKRLDEILGPMLTAADDKSPLVSWSQTEVRRFQG
ncbi:MAG: tRNA lysidine(34) synthetase TilS, partial [Gammaproteobacteria bacterium]|nr:tRNA lysidine(34) synthetase TilS [Gammaproteobacteria bacterium]